MTKRAAGKFERQARDFYATPESAVLKLLPHIIDIETFVEPMCGDGAIIRALESRGWHCTAAWDIEPTGEMADRAGTWDVLGLMAEDLGDCDAVISNPPWPLPSKLRGGLPEGSPTIQIIEHLMNMKPTWLILAADFMHNRYFAPLAPYCTKIVSVGRVKWMAGTKNTGFDNAAWYRFDGKAQNSPDWFAPNEKVRPVYHPSIEGVL